MVSVRFQGNEVDAEVERGLAHGLFEDFEGAFRDRLAAVFRAKDQMGIKQ